MAATVNFYKVLFHFEQSGRKIGPDYSEYVQAAGNDYASLKAVIVTSNARTYGAATFVVDNVINIGPGGVAIA
jgi:hypothetical protein